MGERVGGVLRAVAWDAHLKELKELEKSVKELLAAGFAPHELTVIILADGHHEVWSNQFLDHWKAGYAAARGEEER